MPAFLTPIFVWLWEAIVTLLPMVLLWLAKFLTKKTFYMAAYYTSYAALTVGVFETLNLSITAIAPTLPTNYHIAAGLFLPSNAYACLAAVATAYVLRWIYDYQVKLLDVAQRTWANL